MSRKDLDLERVREHLVAEAAAVAGTGAVIDEAFAEIVRLVDAATGKVLVTAVGNSGAIAARLAHVLALCGMPALHLDANLALHGSVGAVRAGDVLLVLSKGGATEEVNDFARLAKPRGAVIVAVTERPSSPLAEIADHVQTLPASHADPGGAIGMGSALAQAAWGDALALALMLLRGERLEDVVARHPRGLVGKTGSEAKR